MNARTLLILAALTAGVATTAYLVTRQQSAAVAPDADRTHLTPGLKDTLNNVAQLSITSGGRQLTFSLTNQTWGIDQRSGYPAQFEKIKQALVSLADLKILEPRTSRPDLYSRIGVEDPAPVSDVPPSEATPPTSTSTLVTLKDAAGATLASLIIGNRAQAMGGSTGSAEGLYVRRQGEEQSFLATPDRGGRLPDLPLELTQWVDPAILQIAQERMKSVQLTRSNGEVVSISRDQEGQQAFTLADLPEGRELRFPGAADALGSALAYVALEDVARPAAVGFSGSPDQPAKPHIVEFRTFDGLVIAMLILEAPGGKFWATIESSFDASVIPTTPPADAPADAPPDAPKPDTARFDNARDEAATLAARLGGWAFQLQNFKATQIVADRESYLKPLTDPSAQQPGQPPAGMQPAAPWER